MVNYSGSHLTDEGLVWRSILPDSRHHSPFRVPGCTIGKRGINLEGLIRRLFEGKRVKVSEEDYFFLNYKKV